MQGEKERKLKRNRRPLREGHAKCVFKSTFKFYMM